MSELETLQLALQKKCDQYMKLQMAYQSRKEQLQMYEEALQLAKNKIARDRTAERGKVKVSSLGQLACLSDTCPHSGAGGCLLGCAAQGPAVRAGWRPLAAAAHSCERGGRTAGGGTHAL